MVLTAELQNDPLRFNNVCLHFGVAPAGQATNQVGMPAVSVDDFGELFPAIASEKSTQRGTLCVTKLEEVAEFVKNIK